MKAKYFVTYIFDNGCYISEDKDGPEYIPEMGDWTLEWSDSGRPDHDSPAYGWYESFFQSDFVPNSDTWGRMIRAIVSLEKPTLTVTL